MFIVHKKVNNKCLFVLLLFGIEIFHCASVCCCLQLSMRLATFTPRQFSGMPLRLKETNISSKHNRPKNPTGGRRTNRLFTKRDRRVKLGSTENQVQLSGQRGTLKSGGRGFQSRKYPCLFYSRLLATLVRKLSFELLKIDQLCISLLLRELTKVV